MGIAEQAAGQGGSGRHRRPDPAWPGLDDAHRRANRWATYRPTRHARPEIGPTTAVSAAKPAATRSRTAGPTRDTPDADADQPAEPDQAAEPDQPVWPGRAAVADPLAAPGHFGAPDRPAGTDQPAADQPTPPYRPDTLGRPAGTDQPAAPDPPDTLDQPAGADRAGAEAQLSGTLAPRTALTAGPAGAGSAGLGAPRPVDPLVDSGSVGLRMFNLGTIPASVTPPRSWRRAAWFAIASSMAALAGLLVAGALLVGPTHEHARITALPYFPDGSPLRSIGDPTDDPTTRGHHDDEPTVRPDSRPNAGPAARPTAATDPATGATDDGATQAPPPPGGSGTAGHDPTSTDEPANPPVQVPPDPIDTVTVTGGATGDPVADPDKMIKRTRTFFAEVTSNAQAAANLTAGALHDDAVAAIRQRYGDVSAIKIQRISLDPSHGVTVCLLRVVNKDGTTQTQQTTLHFTLSGDPKITNPGG